MQKLSLTLVCVIAIAASSPAQTNDSLLEKNREFTGAIANEIHYNAIYQLDNNDPKIIEKALRNIKNCLNDPRLAGKIQIELIAFSSGTDAYLKGSKYEEDLKALINKGVIVAQCNNTLTERKISRDSLYDFIGIVPTANGELVLRQAEGWAIVKP